MKVFILTEELDVGGGEPTTVIIKVYAAREPAEAAKGRREADDPSCNVSVDEWAVETNDRPLTVDDVHAAGLPTAATPTGPGGALVAVVPHSDGWQVALCVGDEWHLLPVECETLGQFRNLVETLNLPWR